MKGARARIGRAVAAFAAIAGVLLQLLVVAFHGPVVASSTSVDAQTIVICTAHGTATVSIDADGNPIDAPSPLQQRTACDLCLGIGALAIAPPADGFVLVHLPQAILPRPESVAIIDATSGRTHRNRGPPSPSIA